ncbi:hypothetical protein AVEN_224981-1 [Araneus ventricosus]|uniref:Uncharacterized protein n=1 Tax=Araneus ventricosus TaxID=182803 RepID=A0A4Y2VHC6_ARAVE|nr:hypothetical protein AVEN_224981-1 [Araneus ventricosus]
MDGQFGIFCKVLSIPWYLKSIQFRQLHLPAFESSNIRSGVHLLKERTTRSNTTLVLQDLDISFSSSIAPINLRYGSSRSLVIHNLQRPSLRLGLLLHIFSVVIHERWNEFNRFGPFSRQSLIEGVFLSLAEPSKTAFGFLVEFSFEDRMVSSKHSFNFLKTFEAFRRRTPSLSAMNSGRYSSSKKRLEKIRLLPTPRPLLPENPPARTEPTAGWAGVVGE